MAETMNKNNNISESTTETTQSKQVEKNPVKLTAKGKIDRGLYLEWVSIPSILRIAKDDELKRLGYDTNSAVFMKMLRIKSKGEFCTEFGISKNQPAKWESEPAFWDEVNALNSRNHIMKHKKDVDFAFTMKTIKHADAQRTKLWYQKNEGWSEKTEHINLNMNLTPADLVKDIEARNKEIRDNLEE